MKVDFKCKVCGHETTSMKRLIGHFSPVHGLSSKEYYDKFYKQPAEGICECGNPTNYYKLSSGYNKFCDECNSKKCYSKIVCKICNTEFGGSGGGLGQHLKHKHSMSSEEYYNQYIKVNESEGKCKYCGNITMFLGINRGYKKYCSDKCSANDPEVKEKRELTNIERFGYRHNWASPELREKGQYKTNIEKYGNRYPQKLEAIKNRAKETCIEKYGVDNYAKTDECRTKTVTTCLEISNGKYTNTSQFPETIEKSQQSFFERMLVEKREQYKNLVDIVGYKTRTLVCKCYKCEKIYEIAEQTLKLRLDKQLEPCIYCNPLNTTHISGDEIRLAEYIESIYSGKIIRNDRTVLNGKELDVYLPELKLAFEFDGTYWHADPRFYEESDIITMTKQTAGDIWRRDEEKNQLCESLGIRLVRIKEHDWVNNNDIVKGEIIKYLK